MFLPFLGIAFVISRSLVRLRREAARKLEPFIGHRMTRALSQAERCLYRGRIRRFDADEIVAFARAFDLPVLAFFAPPESRLRGKRVFVNGKPGRPWGRIKSPPLTRNEMMVLSARALMPNTDATVQEMGVIFRDALVRVIRGYLEQHPEALPTVASGQVPSAVFESITPPQEERVAKEVVNLLERTQKRKR